MVQSNVTDSKFKAVEHRNFIFFSLFSLTALLWASISISSRQPSSTALIQFLLSTGAMMLCGAIVVWYYESHNQKIAFRWIFISALILRLISLLGEPLFEDDYFRYMWDGFQTATTGDPYTFAPAVFFDQDIPEVFEPILSFINYPDIATVYGPVSQWIFAFGYLVEAGEIWPLQLMATVADMWVLYVLFKMGAGNILLLYAWSPLLLKEFSLTAHPDIYAILGVTLSVYAAFKHRAVLAGTALAIACGSKVFAILVLPYLLTRGWSIRSGLTLCLSFTVSLLAITAWFGDFTIWAPEGLLAMADSWLFNAPVYLLLLNVIQFTAVKLLLLSLFFVFGLITIGLRLRQNTEISNQQPLTNDWSKSNAAFRGDWLYALFLLSIPVINPWYVAWLLPFATLFPRWWSWTASYAVLLSYWYGINITGHSSISDQPSVSVIAIEYGAMLIIPLIAWAIKTKKFNDN